MKCHFFNALKELTRELSLGAQEGGTKSGANLTHLDTRPVRE